MSTGEVSIAGDVVTTVRILAPADAVFDYLVEPEKLLTWMGVEAAIDPRHGGNFWLDVNGQDKAGGRYVEVVRPRRVSFTWGWEGNADVVPGSSLVTIDLVVDGDETVVTLTHSGLPVEATASHLEGWMHFLPQLVVAVS